MFQQSPILVVEDEPLLALDIDDAVREEDGVVVGPYATVAAALVALETHNIVGAILDVQLADRDVSPLVLTLVKRGIPIVIHTGTGLTSELEACCPHLPVLIKPTPTQVIVQTLWAEIQKFRLPK